MTVMKPILLSLAVVAAVVGSAEAFSAVAPAQYQQQRVTKKAPTKADPAAQTQEALAGAAAGFTTPAGYKSFKYTGGTMYESTFDLVEVNGKQARRSPSLPSVGSSQQKVKGATMVTGGPLHEKRFSRIAPFL